MVRKKWVKRNSLPTEQRGCVCVTASPECIPDTWSQRCMTETLDSQVALSLHSASTRDAEEWKLLWECVCSQLCVPIGIREGLEGEEEAGLERGGN